MSDDGGDTDSAPDNPADNRVDDPPGDVNRGEWLLDSTIGAAAVLGRAAASIGRTPPVRAAESAARFVTRPLTQDGNQVRGRLGSDAGPAATELMQQVTPAVLEAVSLDDVVRAIDVDALLDKIDIGRLLDRIDVDAIVERVDVDAIVARVDIDGIVARLDIDALMENIDLNALLARIDLDQLLERVDIDRLMGQTELGGIIARSTSGVASTALDAVRSQGVTLDNVVNRVVARLLRRNYDELPAGPPLLVVPAPQALSSGTAEETIRATGDAPKP